MQPDRLFDAIQNGEMTREEFRQQVSLEYLNLAGESMLDIHRDARTGIPEIIYAEHKTEAQVLSIARAIYKEKGQVLISRYPDNERLATILGAEAPLHQTEKLLVMGPLPEARGAVVVISGGSADHPQAAEAALTLKALGINALLYEDRGIAHPTRVIDALKEALPQEPVAIVAVAGMEASLATFVSSLVPLPVIGVPTSVGYGVKAGEAALYSMLASCTPNLTVVNIDGGLRAAVVAALIVRK